MRRVSMLRTAGVVAAAVFLLATSVLAQQVTGGVAGTAKDQQGGVLPGVTVVLTGEALIAGAQTAISGADGTYQISGLPPGMYLLTYELGGFRTLKREGVRVQVAQSTRVDVEMLVGALEEAVTVTGSSPAVDVTNTTTQTNIDKDFYDAVPTARNPWVMAALVPGVVASTLDVGGTSGMQQYNLQAYGSSASQRSLSVDGVKMNWSGGDGGSANQYYGNEMFDEYNLQTASGTAEADVSGVFTNQVTKSGGNRLSGEFAYLFMNSSMQSDNVDEYILGRLQVAPGTQVAAAGNPTDIMYDYSASIGGPIKRDKLWFFGSFRWFRLDQFQIGALNPDGSLAIDDNLLRVGLGKATYQATNNARLSLVYIPHVRERFHRRNAPFLAVPDKAAIHNILDTESSVASWNQVLGSSAVLNVSFGRVWGDFSNRYQQEVGPNDIVVSDTIRNQRFNAHTLDEVNPNSRTQLTTSLSYFKNGLGGSHDMKVGYQRSLDIMDWERQRNFDMQLVLQDGKPTHALLSNTPVSAKHRWNTFAVFVQDSMRLNRTTLNLGVRFDGARAWLPAQSSPAGLWVGERSFSSTDVYDFSVNVGPRLGVVQDIFGNGRTAAKAYYGRFYDQFGANLPEDVNPNNSTTVQVPWADLNGNFTYDPGELDLRPFVGFPPGVFPVMLPDSRRPFSEEVSFALEQDLGNDLGVAISYHRRMFRNGLVQLDRARPASAYTPVERIYTDPYDKQLKPITVYNLAASLVTVRDRVIGNLDGGSSNYNGFEATVTKKMSNRWQMLGGMTFSSHKGFNYAVPYAAGDLNDPNTRINADNGSVREDLPWTAKLAGSVVLPWDVMLAGKFNARAGAPLQPTLSVSGLRQGNIMVNVEQRGEHRTEAVTNFIDLRFSKRFGAGTSRFEVAWDIYNILNANPVLSENQGIGSTFGRPQSILAPRIMRLNLTARF